MGDLAEDLSLFMGAVIDDRSYETHKIAIERAHGLDHISVVAGGQLDDGEGWFVRPTILESSDPTDEIFTTEYLGPILGLHVRRRQLRAHARADGVGRTVRATG